jgi:hypothetical protein
MLNGLELIIGAGSWGPGAWSADAIARCTDGKVVVGAGGVTALSGSVPLNWLRPIDGGTALHVRVVFDPSVPATSEGAVFAYARCAYPPPGYVFDAVGTQFSTASALSATVSCPAGTSVLSTGLTMSHGPGYGFHHLRSIKPWPDGAGSSPLTSSVFATDLGHRGLPFAIGAWVICAI